MKKKNYISLIKTYLIRLYLAIINSDKMYYDFENLTNKEIYYLYFKENKRRINSKYRGHPSKLEIEFFQQFILSMGRAMNSAHSLTSGDKVLENVKPYELEDPCGYEVVEKYVAKLPPAELKRLIAIERFQDQTKLTKEDSRISGLSKDDLRREIEIRMIEAKIREDLIKDGSYKDDADKFEEEVSKKLKLITKNK